MRVTGYIQIELNDEGNEKRWQVVTASLDGEGEDETAAVLDAMEKLVTSRNGPVYDAGGAIRNEIEAPDIPLWLMGEGLFAPAWTAVGEGLPDEPGEYLVATSDPTAGVIIAQWDSGWFVPGSDGRYLTGGEHVTHWMPLPERPPEQTD